MNIRDALAAIFVLELLVLLALGQYSHQLHQLQNKRELLTFKSSTAPSISSKVGSSSSPPVSAENRSKSELPTKLGCASSLERINLLCHTREQLPHLRSDCGAFPCLFDVLRH